MQFPFPFESMFGIFFVLFLIVMVFSVIAWIFRIIKGGREALGEEEPKDHVVVKEREIIREIVKIRCSYCGNLYDETLDKCPHCGGKKL